jgi:putative DNA primase/helicase
MLQLAQKERGMPVKEDSLDQNAYYFNCPNGVLDLRTGVLMEPKQEWLITKTSTTRYNPDAQCPRFMKFLDETFEGNSGLINFMQRWLGYSLTADTSAQAFAVFYGVGANGKSTLVELIQKIAGDYVKTAPPDTFIQKQNGGIPNDIAALRGSRMVLTTETEANARLAEAKVKSMTGGDRVSARYMRGEFFEFTPTWKITISTNHRPKISGGDYGIWRRVVLVPFNNVVTLDRQDPNLQNKLLEEAEGVLSWLVNGAMAWYSSGQGRMGLQVPEIVYDETQEYREDEDVIGRFLAQACYTPAEISAKMRSGELVKDGTNAIHVFYSFRNWCTKEGEEGYARTTQNMFGRYMRERGYIALRTSNAKHYPGVVPKSEWYRTSD